MSQELFRINNMIKTFGATRALKGVDFVLNRGEVRGLVGENGSGKSTMTSIIAGFQKCDSGQMFLEGRPYSPANMQEARENKVAMIVQEIGTIAGIGIAENMFLGEIQNFSKGSLIDKKKLHSEARKAFENIGITSIDPSRPTSSINLEDRKLLEIASAMRCDPDILIVDETTTALSQNGRDVIYNLMNKLVSENKSVIFISHDLDEIMEVCNSITVLRDGVMIGDLVKDDFEKNKIQNMMVGREIKGDYYRADYEGSCSDEVIMKVEHLYGLHTLRDINLELHKGEILGIGGLSECGMHELGRAMFGVDIMVSGSVIVNGKKITKTHQAAASGIGYVSKNRDTESLMLQAGIGFNITIPSLEKVSVSGIISKSKEKKYIQEQIDALSIKCEGASQKTRALSGGNKQKVAFAKWIGKGSQILVFDCPTRGVDVGVKAAMYRLIEDLKKDGHGVVLISEELPELIGMSDRIIIMKNGRIEGEHKRSASLTEHDLIKEMI